MNLHSSLTRLAGLCLLVSGSAAQATTTSLNFGSLGHAGDGTNADAVALNQAGALAVSSDKSAGYSGGANTTIPFQAALNPGAASAFTIEFWANPSASDNDDATISNRFATGNRSGWTFFQRAPATGWNFRMYNGVGSAL